jgi:hypothetical protein
VGSRRAATVVGVAVALVLLAVSFTGPTASAATAEKGSGGIGIRLLADASSSSAEPLSLSYIAEPMTPGGRVARHVEISNTTDATADVVVYPAGADIVRNQFAFAPGTTGDQLSDWTTVGQSALRLAPGAKTVDDVTIAIPSGASPGERYGVVWAQVSAPSTTQSKVRLVNRVGVRMYVSVGGGGTPPEFTVGPLAASRSSGGNPLIVAGVHNTGQAALDITGELTLSDGPGGVSAGPFPVELGTLLAPGHSATERVQLPRQLPRGPWRAALTLSSDGAQRNSVATITFPGPPQVAGGRTLAAPVIVGALLLLTLLLVAGLAASLIGRHHRVLVRPV